MLLIDCGNTRLKWCLVSKGELTQHGEVFVDSLDIGHLFSKLSLMSFSRVVVASVKLSEKLDKLLSMLSGVAVKGVKIIQHADFRGQQFAYERVESLGIDRCLVVLAARNLSSCGAMVIDSGSAMTADFIAVDGSHIGGYIFPGYRMLQDSLISGTSKIMLEKEVEVSMMPGTSTESCVINGLQVILSQSIGFLESQCAEYGIGKIYVAGGDAELVSRFMNMGCEIRETLLFEGMLFLAEDIFGFEEII